jgi:hypothetical protein
MPDTKPIEQSFLSWFYYTLGLQYAILLPLAGLICFLLALILVLRGKGPMAAAGLILIVHVPLFIGVFAAIQGIIASYTIIAGSAVTPKPSELAAGYSMALVAPMVGMVLMVPGYTIAVLGTMIRSLVADCAETSANHRRNRVDRSFGQVGSQSYVG